MLHYAAPIGPSTSLLTGCKEGKDRVMVAIVVVLVLVALLAIGAAAWFYSKQRRTTALQERFGPEYDHALQATGDQHQAERELESRQKRVDQLNIRPLSS